MFDKKKLTRSEWNEVIKRLDLLEEKVYKKNKRLKATVPQKVLLLHHLGILDNIESLGLSQNQKALLVSVLTDSDLDNTEKELNKVHMPDSDQKRERNYSFLTEFFDDLGLEKTARVCETILIKAIARREENNK